MSRNRPIATGVAFLVAAAVFVPPFNASGTIDWRDLKAIVSIVAGIALVAEPTGAQLAVHPFHRQAVLGGTGPLSLRRVVMVASQPPIILLRRKTHRCRPSPESSSRWSPAWLRTTKELSGIGGSACASRECADIAASPALRPADLTLIRSSRRIPRVRNRPDRGTRAAPGPTLVTPGRRLLEAAVGGRRRLPLRRPSRSSVT